MNEQEMLLRFFQVVAFDLQHKDYQHVVSKARTYMQLVAGIGLDDLLKQYVPRENKALFKQRLNITNHIVTAVCNNLLKPLYKVPRSNSARRVLTYEGNNPDGQTQKLEDILKVFWGLESWDDYMATRYIELNSVDPNSFTVFEWDPFDGKKESIKPRPFEVSAKEAIDYRYKNKNLQYLTVKKPIKVKPYEAPGFGNRKVLKNPNNKEDSGADGFKFTLYGPNSSYDLIQVDEKSLLTATKPEDGKVFRDGQNDYVKLGSVYYQFVKYKPHNAGAVPAFRTGYLRDLATAGRTCVNPLHAVEPYLLKTIKVNSEFDLVATLLAHPQRIEYGNKCEDTKCLGGYYHDGSECGTCHGSGIKQTAPTAQDTIRILMPRSKEEMIPLGEMVTYVRPPVDIVQWQEEYIENLTKKCQTMMYNSDTFTKSQVAETGIGKALDLQNVYDTLYPFAVTEAKVWTFGIKVIAKLADLSKGLICNKTYGKDFKLKSLDTLIMDLSIASNIGNPTLIRHLNNDIAHIIFSEKPIELLRYQLQEAFNPFAGKSEKEVMLLMASDFVSMKQKVLHANYGRIFDELELEFAKEKKIFYKLNRSDQRTAIYKKVDEIIAEIEASRPDPELLLE